MGASKKIPPYAQLNAIILRGTLRGELLNPHEEFGYPDCTIISLAQTSKEGNMTMMSRDDAIRFNALVSFMLWLAYLACI